MAYFSHAFRKTIVVSSYEAPVPATPTAASGELTAGQVSLYDAKAWTPLDVATPSQCQFILAAGAPYPNDRIGPFHGGYTESIKTKGINPKYVTKVWEQDSNAPQQSILHIGTTPFTAGTADCCPEFVCGENYHLRVDVKGNPVLRTLNHQGYVEVSAYGGCCPEDAVSPVQINPVEIMLQWQQGIVESVVVTGNGPNGRTNPEPFIIPVVTVSAAGAAGAIGDGATLIYPEGTDAAVLAAGVTATNTHLGLVGPATVIATTADAYTAAAYTDECAGLTLVGAYVDTQFGDCTFQPSDFYGLEPIRIYASEVDLNGDPCAFTGICVVSECEGRQAQGLGETVARDFILSESYRQNHFATDLRIREITQGNAMLGTGAGQVDRTELYDRLMILHNVPRFNNPTGTFDNDQYLIELVAKASDAVAVAALGSIKTDILAVLTAAGNGACVEEAATAAVACPAPSVVVTA